MSRAEGIDEPAPAELNPQAAMRLRHAGRWVAWTEGFGRVVAAGDSRDEARAAAMAAGVPRPICEWISPDPARRVGGE